MKQCTKCNVKKPLAEFSKHKLTKGGFQSNCKVCKNKTAKNKYFNNPEKAKLAVKNYRHDNPEKVKQAIKKWQTSKQGIYEWYEGKTSLYVGKSKGLNNRINNHKWLFKNPESSKKSKHAQLYDSLRTHPNASIRVLEECVQEVLLEREQYYIDILKPLYNTNSIT